MNQENNPEPNLLKAISFSSKFGWWSLLSFVILGVILESLHGFKSQWYLNVSNETRRFMLTLGHAHGGLLAIINIAYAICLKLGFYPNLKNPMTVSLILSIASLLIPLGFITGGIWNYGSDPGPGIILVPVGALLLITGIFWSSLKLGSEATKPKSD